VDREGYAAVEIVYVRGKIMRPFLLKKLAVMMHTVGFNPVPGQQIKKVQPINGCEAEKFVVARFRRFTLDLHQSGRRYIHVFVLFLPSKNRTGFLNLPIIHSKPLPSLSEVLAGSYIDFDLSLSGGCHWPEIIRGEVKFRTNMA
jgi:hypothetical protein